MGQELQDLHLLGFKPNFNDNFKLVTKGGVKYFSRHNVDVTIAIYNVFKVCTSTTWEWTMAAIPTLLEVWLRAYYTKEHSLLDFNGKRDLQTISKRDHDSKEDEGSDSFEESTTSKSLKSFIFHTTTASSVIHFTPKDSMCKTMSSRNYNFTPRVYRACNHCNEDYEEGTCKHQITTDFKQ